MWLYLWATMRETSMESNSTSNNKKAHFQVEFCEIVQADWLENETCSDQLEQM